MEISPVEAVSLLTLLLAVAYIRLDKYLRDTRCPQNNWGGHSIISETMPNMPHGLVCKNCSYPYPDSGSGYTFRGALFRKPVKRRKR